jgi:hypothetical protein
MDRSGTSYEISTNPLLSLISSTIKSIDSRLSSVSDVVHHSQDNKKETPMPKPTPAPARRAAAPAAAARPAARAAAPARKAAPVDDDFGDFGDFDEEPAAPARGSRKAQAAPADDDFGDFDNDGAADGSDLDDGSTDGDFGDFDEEPAAPARAAGRAAAAGAAARRAGAGVGLGIGVSFLLSCEWCTTSLTEDRRLSMLLIVEEIRDNNGFVEIS